MDVTTPIREFNNLDWVGFKLEIESMQTRYRGLLFRGQSDSAFGLTTTLERAGCEGMSFADYYSLVYRIRPAAETFTGLKWEDPLPPSKSAEMFINRGLLQDSPRPFPERRSVSVSHLLTPSWLSVAASRLVALTLRRSLLRLSRPFAVAKFRKARKEIHFRLLRIPGRGKGWSGG